MTLLQKKENLNTKAERLFEKTMWRDTERWPLAEEIRQGSDWGKSRTT